MSADTDRSKRRAERPKSRPRTDAGLKIVVRVSAEEKERLVAEAGDAGVSALVRTRLFGGRFHHRLALRRIAALHGLGKSLMLLAGAQSEKDAIDNALAKVRSAIDELVSDATDRKRKDAS